jgi:hypothetical protein
MGYRAKEILERVLWREKIKKAILKVEFCLQFAKDIKDIPPNIISENDQFCKEVAREKAKREAAKKIAMGITEEQPRPRQPMRPQMPSVVPVDGSVGVSEEQPAVSEERAESIRRCFQHLMMEWDESRECPGTSALPLTADGRMCTESSCHSGYCVSVCVCVCVCFIECQPLALHRGVTRIILSFPRQIMHFIRLRLSSISDRKLVCAE